MVGPAVVLDPRFAACVVDGADLDRLWTGGVWVEGPAWLPPARSLVWSDIPNDRMLRWDAVTGEVSLFRHPSHGGNGNTVDRQGRLVTCEQAKRRVTRTEADGALTVLADHFAGRRFNAPNDVVVKSDGSVWFTDPDYGRNGSAYEGTRELDGCHVYRIDPDNGAVRQMTDDFVMPNGLAFSPDESVLYVADTGSTHIENGPNHIRRFAVGSDSNLTGGEVFATDTDCYLDGFRCDAKGRLWCGAGDGVHCYEPDGPMIGRIAVPERVANLTFGGQDGRDLLMCGTTSLYRFRVNVTGARDAG